MGRLEADEAPAGLVDMVTEIPPVPSDWQLDAYPSEDEEEIMGLFFTRTVADPVSQQHYQANEMRDFFRFGWEPTNLQVPVGKKKAVGSSGWELDGLALTPVISPGSYFTASDYKEWRHCINLCIVTKSNENKKDLYPKHLREWHKDDLADLMEKFKRAEPWLKKRGPQSVDENWNLFKGNRHPRETQRAHHAAALTWQLMQGYEKSKGMLSPELDAWCQMLAIDMMVCDPSKGDEVDYKLAQFIANRLEDTVNLENFNEMGFQNYMSRYVFLCYWLGEADEAWDAACEISKLRGGEFTKSPMYDAIIEMREEPDKIADCFEDNPKECLQYFRI